MILYDIADGQINHWINNYEKSGYDGLNNKPKGRHNEKRNGLWTWIWVSIIRTIKKRNGRVYTIL